MRAGNVKGEKVSVRAAQGAEAAVCEVGEGTQVGVSSEEGPQGHLGMSG